VFARWTLGDQDALRSGWGAPVEERAGNNTDNGLSRCQTAPRGSS
jgi:hypothetical protein